MTTEDLWGEIPLGDKQQTPLTILKEQADLLTKKTGGEIEGVVFAASENNKFSGKMRLKVPKLGKFFIDVIFIRYSIGLYPVYITPSIFDSDYEVPVDNIDEFKTKLRDIFQSEELTTLIRKVRTQIVSMEGDFFQEI